MYRRRFGCYPERILADKIYRSKSSRAFCKSHGIRLSGPKLGLSLIIAKLQITAGSLIGIDIFILNMEKMMK